MARRAVQLSLPAPRTWGGRRPGAGRKPVPGRRPGVPHRARPHHVAAHPVHVTLRAVDAVRSLRSGRLFPAVRRALAASSHAEFRILEFSIQDDHVHLNRRGQTPAGALGRSPRPRHSRCPCGEPRARPPRAGLLRPLPRPGPDDPARRAPCARVRLDELPKASEARDRDRSVLVGSVVRGVARASGSGGDRCAAERRVGRRRIRDGRVPPRRACPAPRDHSRLAPGERLSVRRGGTRARPGRRTAGRGSTRRGRAGDRFRVPRRRRRRIDRGRPAESP